MKVYPKEKVDQNGDMLQHLSKTDKVTRQIAIWVAFASVFIFFIKLLFL